MLIPKLGSTRNSCGFGGEVRDFILQKGKAFNVRIVVERQPCFFFKGDLTELKQEHSQVIRIYWLKSTASTNNLAILKLNPYFKILTWVVPLPSNSGNEGL